MCVRALGDTALILNRSLFVLSKMTVAKLKVHFMMTLDVSRSMLSSEKCRLSIYFVCATSIPHSTKTYVKESLMDASEWDNLAHYSPRVVYESTALRD